MKFPNCNPEISALHALQKEQNLKIHQGFTNSPYFLAISVLLCDRFYYWFPFFSIKSLTILNTNFESSRCGNCSHAVNTFAAAETFWRKSCKCLYVWCKQCININQIMISTLFHFLTSTILVKFSKFNSSWDLSIDGVWTIKTNGHLRFSLFSSSVMHEIHHKFQSYCFLLNSQDLPIYIYNVYP